MSREPVPMIQTVEQPELPEKAQMRLERDKTYFLDNPNARALKRPFVDGEALPYTMPPLATVVEVLRSGRRTYVVGGKPIIIITPPPQAQIREKRYKGSIVLTFKGGRVTGRDTKVNGVVVKREVFVVDLADPKKRIAVEVPLDGQA